VITFTREEAQQVLDALENNAWIAPIDSTLSNFGLTLRSRLAQPEPEPVAKMKELLEVQGRDGNWNLDPYMQGMYNGMELMVALAEGRDPVFRKTPEKWINTPPQRVYCSCGDGIVPDDGALCGICVSLKKMREWQGLTDDEIIDTANNAPFESMVSAEDYIYVISRAIEAKLKEKNA
jgi:hypothetical protein